MWHDLAEIAIYFLAVFWPWLVILGPFFLCGFGALVDRLLEWIEGDDGK